MSIQHVPDEGCRFLLDLLLSAFGSTLNVHLYQNAHVPSAADTVASYVEADFEGYAPQPATAWSAAATVAGITSAFADELTYTKGIGGVGNSVYGYYVTDSTDGVLLWAERDPRAPVSFSVDGDVYQFSPRLRLGSAP